MIATDVDGDFSGPIPPTYEACTVPLIVGPCPGERRRRAAALLPVRALEEAAGTVSAALQALFPDGSPRCMARVPPGRHSTVRIDMWCACSKRRCSGAMGLSRGSPFERSCGMAHSSARTGRPHG